jgi:hypothetical protein
VLYPFARKDDQPLTYPPLKYLLITPYEHYKYCDECERPYETKTNPNHFIMVGIKHIFTTDIIHPY